MCSLSINANIHANENSNNILIKPQPAKQLDNCFQNALVQDGRFRQCFASAKRGQQFQKKNVTLNYAYSPISIKGKIKLNINFWIKPQKFRCNVSNKYYA